MAKRSLALGVAAALAAGITSVGAATSASAGGAPTPKPLPSKPSTPECPCPTPTKPAPAPTPTKPAPVPTPTKPAPVPTPTVPAPVPPITPAPTPTPDVPVTPEGDKDITYVAQVDTYRWKSKAYGAKIAAFDDDGVLRYREDGFLWMTRAAKKYTSYGHTFVTFQAAKGASKADLVAAYNSAAPASLRIATTARLGAVGAKGQVIDVWMLGAGATPKAAWGAKKNVNQVYLGRR